MARSSIQSPTDDLITDSGAVIWSIVKGEQLEFPVTLNFVEDSTIGYVFEATVVEAENVYEQQERPTAIKTGGVTSVLNVRVMVNRGNWDAAQAYSKEEVVAYSGKVYKKNGGIAQTNATPPDVSPLWSITTLSTVYLQFPKTLGTTWAVQPSVAGHTYGFFELRVTEPADAIFVRTWKPVRGMIEIQFSPTYSIGD